MYKDRQSSHLLGVGLVMAFRSPLTSVFPRRRQCLLRGCAAKGTVAVGQPALVGRWGFSGVP